VRPEGLGNLKNISILFGKKMCVTKVSSTGIVHVKHKLISSLNALLNGRGVFVK
jgi:hypothetical protein